MSNIKICANCGCTDIVSDRSLGGRMVCSRCGSSSFSTKYFLNRKTKNIIYCVIAIITLFLVIFKL